MRRTSILSLFVWPERHDVCKQVGKKPTWASSVTPGPDLKEFENLNFNFEHRGMEGTGAVEWRGIARKAFLGSKFSHRACGP
jgi:hypothetical protein